MKKDMSTVKQLVIGERHNLIGIYDTIKSNEPKTNKKLKELKQSIVSFIELHA